MNPILPAIDFGQCLRELGLPEVRLPAQRPAATPPDAGQKETETPAAFDLWQYHGDSDRQLADVAEATANALAAPHDFPPLEMAVVEGDRVALAVDPNVPQVVDVVVGGIRALRSTAAEHVDVVLGDEVTETTWQAVQASLTEWLAEDYVSLFRHASSDREALRYLGAGVDALPWYLSRPLVDADVVVPIVIQRPTASNQQVDITGLYPAFADAATRQRGHESSFRKGGADDDDDEGDEAPEIQIPWLVGVQLMIAVAANQLGGVSRILAATPHGVANQESRFDADAHDFPPPADLVIASLDGDRQQQTWANLARAASTATRYAKSGATILIWTAINEPPPQAIRQTLESTEIDAAEKERWEHDQDAHAADTHDPDTHDEDDAASADLPAWDASITTGNLLARVAAEHRLVIRSHLGPESLEPLGFGALETTDELKRLMESFAICGVVRAAQFAAAT